jgi:hypothetical protein
MPTLYEGAVKKCHQHKRSFMRQNRFIHFGSWFYKNTLSARQTISILGKEKGINAIIGYDGMEINSEGISKTCR